VGFAGLAYILDMSFMRHVVAIIGNQKSSVSFIFTLFFVHSHLVDNYSCTCIHTPLHLPLPSLPFAHPVPTILNPLPQLPLRIIQPAQKLRSPHPRLRSMTRNKRRPLQIRLPVNQLLPGFLFTADNISANASSCCCDSVSGVSRNLDQRCPGDRGGTGS